MRRLATLSTTAAFCAISLLAGCANTQAAPITTSFDGSGASENLEIRLFAVNDLNAFRENFERANRAS